MNTTDLATLRAVALAATPQNIDSAEIKHLLAEGETNIECPCCQGEGHVELEADYCNYDGTAIGVTFYGVGNAHGAAEAYFRAATPANIITLLDALESTQGKLNKQVALVEKCMVAMNENADRGQKAEAEVARLRAVVQANHEWHQNHDDHDGYPESELFELNTAAQPAIVQGPAATMFHDAGAIAQCHYCKRYTLDRKALGDRQPACTCGKSNGWSGSFKQPGPDAQWHDPAPSARPTQKRPPNCGTGHCSCVECVMIPEAAILQRARYHAMPATADDPAEYELFTPGTPCTDNTCIDVLIVRADCGVYAEPAASPR